MIGKGEARYGTTAKTQQEGLSDAVHLYVHAQCVHIRGRIRHHPADAQKVRGAAALDRRGRDDGSDGHCTVLAGSHRSERIHLSRLPRGRRARGAGHGAGHCAAAAHHFIHHFFFLHCVSG